MTKAKANQNKLDFSKIVSNQEDKTDKYQNVDIPFLWVLYNESDRF